MNKHKIYKTIAYLILSILILIFAKQLIDYIAYVVSLLMIIYAFEELMSLIEKKQLLKDLDKSIDVFILCLLALVMILARNNYSTVCIIWAVWSILRENNELVEIIEDIKEGHPFILSASESVLAIVFSILLILNPEKEHVYVHIILLSIELAFNVLLPHLKYFISYKKKNNI